MGRVFRSREDNNRNFRVALTEHGYKIETATRAGHKQIHNDQIDILTGKDNKGSITVICRGYFDILVFVMKGGLKANTDKSVVINYMRTCMFSFLVFTSLRICLRLFHSQTLHHA